MCNIILIIVANVSIAFGKLVKNNFLRVLFPFIQFYKGTLISVVAPSADTAVALSGPLLVPLMIFSGYFLNNA
jgi:hypothetical protein